MGKQNAADILVEHKCPPHTDDTESERDAQHIAESHGHTPHDNDTDDEREVDIAGGTQGIGGVDVDWTANFKYYINPLVSR